MNTIFRISVPAESDAELVRLVKNGNMHAFSLLMDRYHSALHGRANRYARVAGLESEDFLQEGRFALYRAVVGYNAAAGVKFSTYAMACIRNAMLRAMRLHMKHAPAVCLEEADRTHGIVVSDAFVEDILARQHVESCRLQWHSGLLSKLEQQVLQRYLYGRTYRQIAVELRVSPKTVDNALQRIRRKLKPVLRAQVPLFSVNQP